MAKGTGTTRSGSAASPNAIASKQGIKGISEYKPKGEYFHYYDTQVNTAGLISEINKIQSNMDKTKEIITLAEEKAQKSKSKKWKPKFEQDVEDSRNELKGLKNDLKDVKYILGKRGVTDEIIKAYNQVNKTSLKAFYSFVDKIKAKHGIDLLDYE